MVGVDAQSWVPFPSPAGGLLLASRSPRRRDLLDLARAKYRVVQSGIDDSGLLPGRVTPEAWVMALAYLKAASAHATAAEPAPAEAVYLGADTLCVLDGRVVGQPTDADDARAMLLAFAGREHEVVSGVALLCPETGRRVLFCDRARVTWGDLVSAALDDYVASGAWAGKAGGYNLSERLEADWPITFEGDPSSIMGLPMVQLSRRLARFSELAERGS